MLYASELCTVSGSQTSIFTFSVPAIEDLLHYVGFMGSLFSHVWLDDSVQQEKMFGRADILKVVDLRYSSKKDNYICKLFINKKYYMHFLPLVFFMESRKQFMCLLLEIPLRVLSSDNKTIKYELSGVCYGTFYEEWIVTFRNLLVHLNFFQNPMWSFLFFSIFFHRHLI